MYADAVNEEKMTNLPCSGEKSEIFPVWGKLQIKFPVRTKETEANMVLYILIP